MNRIEPYGVHMTVIDGNRAILGRMATHIAKLLMKGESVQLVNAEKVIITGRPEKIMEKYLERRQRGSPQHGPFFPKMPDKLVKRTVRSMLPYKTHKGRKALKRLTVYIESPDDVKEKPISIATKQLKSRYISVGALCKSMGWKG